MSSLADLQGRIEQVLADTQHRVWDSEWIEEGLRQALHEYSEVRPQEKITMLTVAATTREVDISGIADLWQVTTVWLPYTAADPESPPNVERFDFWEDSRLLYFPDYEAQVGEVARIFYQALQTVEGLDGATATTVQAIDETLLVNGAAGQVASSRALDLLDKQGLDKIVAQQARAWGLSKLQEFRAALRRVGRRKASSGRSRIPLEKLDKWDEAWS